MSARAFAGHSALPAIAKGQCAYRAKESGLHKVLFNFRAILINPISQFQPPFCKADTFVARLRRQRSDLHHRATMARNDYFYLRAALAVL